MALNEERPKKQSSWAARTGYFGHRHRTPNANMPWLEEEDLYVKDHIVSQSIHEIARELGRTPRAVSNRARVLGVGKASRNTEGHPARTTASPFPADVSESAISVDNPGLKYLNLREFVELGYLQEINRRLLHPAGLALELEFSDHKNYSVTARVWDCRDDEEGVFFADGVIDQKKIDTVSDLSYRKYEARKAFIGQLIQHADTIINTSVDKQL